MSYNEKYMGFHLVLLPVELWGMRMQWEQPALSCLNIQATYARKECCVIIHNSHFKRKFKQCTSIWDTSQFKYKFTEKTCQNIHAF